MSTWRASIRFSASFAYYMLQILCVEPIEQHKYNILLWAFRFMCSTQNECFVKGYCKYTQGICLFYLAYSYSGIKFLEGSTIYYLIRCDSNHKPHEVHRCCWYIEIFLLLKTLNMYLKPKIIYVMVYLCCLFCTFWWVKST